MNKSRLLLLLGALSMVVPLSGCGTVSRMVETGKSWTAKLTGADNPDDKSLLATAGRMQNAGTDLVAGAVGITPAPAASAPVSVVASAETSPTVASPQVPAAAPVPAKNGKKVVKSAAPKSGTSIKPVAAVTPSAKKP